MNVFSSIKVNWRKKIELTQWWGETMVGIDPMVGMVTVTSEVACRSSVFNIKTQGSSFGNNINIFLIKVTPRHYCPLGT